MRGGILKVLILIEGEIKYFKIKRRATETNFKARKNYQEALIRLKWALIITRIAIELDWWARK